MFLVLTIAFSLSACTDKDTTTSPEKHRIYAGVFWYDFSDDFLSAVRETMNSKFDALGIKYTNYDAGNNKTEQISQIGEAVANGANLLIINIVDNSSNEMAQSIVSIAKAVEVPVIFFNREVSDSIINSYDKACYIGIRAAEAGEKQGIMAGNYILENYDAIDLNHDGNISYIMMKGELGNPDAEARTRYSVEFCNAELTGAGKPELTYYDPNNYDRFYPSNWSQDTAYDAMTTALSTNPMDSNIPIEAVFANNDDAALGCIKALNKVGWNTGSGNSIPVFGIDYTVNAQTAIKSGKMIGSIHQSAFGLANAVTAIAQNVVNGKDLFYSVAKMYNMDDGCAKIRVPYEIITSENSEHPAYTNSPTLPSDTEYSDPPSDSEHTDSPSSPESPALPSKPEAVDTPSNQESSSTPSVPNSPSTPSIPESPDIPDTPSSPNTPISRKNKVAVFWYDYDDYFISEIRRNLNAKLSADGLNYTNYDANCSQATQNNQIDTAISQGTDLLIVNIVDMANSSSAQTIVNKAKAVGIPVIFFDRETTDSVIRSYDKACYVGVRAAEAGERQGQMAGQYIIENYNSIDLNNDGKISYIMMKGQLGNPEAEVRTQSSVEYCNKELTSAGKPKLVYYDKNNIDQFQPSNWSKSQAFDLMTTALYTNPMNSNNPIEVVFANNDDAALGCIEALNNVGWNRGTGKSIPIFGIDYTYDGATAIRAGKMTGSILQSATGIAETIAVLASNVADGEHVFANAANNFNVDSFVNKIRVPFEIMM